MFYYTNECKLFTKYSKKLQDYSLILKGAVVSKCWYMSRFHSVSLDYIGIVISKMTQKFVSGVVALSWLSVTSHSILQTGGGAVEMS